MLYIPTCFYQIPVYKGAHEPFIDPELKGDGYHGKDGFGDLNWKWFPNMDRLKPEIASVAIGRIVRENPDEIIVIATGPLTNIALTTMLYPDFYAKLKELYVMGGNFNGKKCRFIQILPYNINISRCGKYRACSRI